MLNKLEEVADRFREVEGLLSDPKVVKDLNRYRALSQEHAELSDIVAYYEKYCRVRDEISGSQELLKDSDPEVREMASLEVAQLEAEQSDLESQLKVMLLPKDPNDARNVVLEVRAGTGGDEAALFAGDLFRMYTRYAENHGWKVDLLSCAESEAGGFKEVIALISGQGAYSSDGGRCKTSSRRVSSGQAKRTELFGEEYRSNRSSGDQAVYQKLIA